MKLSFIVPMHNEEDNVDKLMEELLKVLEGFNEEVEIILVDDCSIDRTRLMVDLWASRDRRVVAIHRKGEPGFGKALKEGFKHAKGEVLIPFMGDLSDEPEDALKLYRKVVYGGYDVAVGARWRRGGWAGGMPLLKKFLSISFSKLSKLLLGVPTADVTNAFKAYRKQVIKAVKPLSDGFELSAELVIKAYFNGFKIADVPVGWRGRVRGGAKLKLAKMGVNYLKLLSASLINRGRR